MEPKTAEQRLQQMAEDHERRLRALEAQDRRDQPVLAQRGEVDSSDDVSTDNAICRFHGTSGHYIQNSLPTIDDNGNLTINDDDKIYLRNTNSFVWSYQDGRCGFDATSLVGIWIGGAIKWYWNASQFRPGGATKTLDIGESKSAFDDVYADDFHNVADVPFLDDYDDLATIMAIARGERVNERSGLPLIDDATLPEWLLTRDKADGKTILRDENGSPWVSTNNWVGLLLGAVRELTRRTEAQQAEIDALKAAVKALQGARRA